MRVRRRTIAVALAAAPIAYAVYGKRLVFVGETG